ncbi:MAG: prenyltransferase/squalene oxidase repeat-containing protein [Kiritimatiellia bacterium]
MNITTHINSLGASREAQVLRELVSQMRDFTEEEPSDDLIGRIMNAVEQDKKTPQQPLYSSGSRFMKPWFGAAAVAALLILLFVLRFVSVPADENRSDFIRERWLADFQEKDGSWNPARHGGNAAYRPALTALSAMALQRSGDDFTAEVAAARNYLIRIQQADGSFGGSGRERFYNHSIVTYFLADSGRCDSDVLTKAVKVIRKRQTATGGWDYAEGSEGSTAITSWHVQALAAAEMAGVEGASESMRRGLRWLRDMTDRKGCIAYRKNSENKSDTLSALAGYTLLTAGAEILGLSDVGHRVVKAMTASAAADDRTVDLYRDCMKVRAFSAAGMEDDAFAIKKSMNIQNSEAPDDKWEKVGGRIYVASMHSLTGSY